MSYRLPEFKVNVYTPPNPNSQRNRRYEQARDIAGALAAISGVYTSSLLMVAPFPEVISMAQHHELMAGMPYAGVTTIALTAATMALEWRRTALERAQTAAFSAPK